MDGQRFDNIARALAGGTSRRSMLKGLVGGIAGVVAFRAAQTSAQTACASNDDCTGDEVCCRGECHSGSVTICHATGSSSNPYTTITVDYKTLSQAGHCDHEGDLIPAPGGVCPSCIANSDETTCAGVACGAVTNNCGATVNCPNTCGACETCGDNNTCVPGGTACGENCCSDTQTCCNGACIDQGACCADSDCGGCQVCNDNHVCVPGGAACGDGCCDAGQQCCNGTCIDANACCEDSDCGACATCGTDHTCSSSGTACGEACCDPASEQCCNGGCIDANACCTDHDCPNGQTCNNGQCVEQCVADGGECSNTNECCAGSTCACGVCRSGQITICHATGNASDPYKKITIDVSALNDHCGDTGDLIPAPEGGCPPAACTPESKEKTCGSDKCGTKKNNCGQSVVCGACGSGEACEHGACAPAGPTTTNPPTTTKPAEQVTNLPNTGIGAADQESSSRWMGPLAVIGGGAALLASRLRKPAEQPRDE